MLMAKQKQAMNDKIEAEAAAEVVNQNSNANTQVPRKDSISFSVLGWIRKYFFLFWPLDLSSIVYAGMEISGLQGQG